MNAAQPSVEEAFLLDGVFGWVHRPVQPLVQSYGILLCAPFGAAPTGTHRNWRQLAMMLADEGFVTLRFDYPGTGDSAECTSGNRIGDWVRIVRRLAVWLQRENGLKEVVLCGLRFGALLAAEAAGSTQPLILLAPPLSGHAYFRELTVTSRTNPIFSSSEGIVEAHGLILQGEEVAALERLDCQTRLKQRQQPALWLSPDWEYDAATLLLHELQSNEVPVTLTKLEGFRDFMLPAYKAVFPALIFIKLLAWLQELRMTEVPQRIPSPSEEVLHLPNGLEERRIYYGQDNGLFAVETRPDRPAPERPAVVLFNSGAEPHTGHSRLNVLLARRLATKGLAVIRIDLSGLGDSPRIVKDPEGAPEHGETDLAWVRSYRPIYIDDALASLDLLTALGYRHCTLMGLCSGANLALQVALLDARVRRLVLINPTFVDRICLARAAPSASKKMLRRTLRNGLSKLGFKEERRRRIRISGLWFFHEARRGAAWLLRWEDILAPPTRWLWQLRRRGVSMLALSNKGDDSVSDWQIYAGYIRQGRAVRHEHEVMAGKSHSFEPVQMRDRLITRICQYLC